MPDCDVDAPGLGLVREPAGDAAEFSVALEARSFFVFASGRLTGGTSGTTNPAVTLGKPWCGGLPGSSPVAKRWMWPNDTASLLELKHGFIKGLYSGQKPVSTAGAYFRPSPG